MDDAGDDVGKFAAKNTIGLLIKYAFDLARNNNPTAMQTVDNSLSALGTHLNGPNRVNELTQLETLATQSLSSLFSGIGIQIEIPPPSLDEIIKTTTIKLIEDGNQPREPLRAAVGAPLLRPRRLQEVQRRLRPRRRR